MHRIEITGRIQFILCQKEKTIVEVTKTQVGEKTSPSKNCKQY